MTLEEALRIALQNSPLMRTLGGRVVETPGAAVTTFDPAITESDPLYGPQGALSAFDPQWTSSAMWIHNDRVVNNILQGGGVRQLQEKQWNYETGVKKIAATGTQFTMRGITAYDANNATGNLFPSAWDSQLETGFRHPFLQGGGIEFNRIAGPNSQPGFYFSNGVLLARVRTDLSLADFEAGVTGYVNDVETAYWRLYLAYRELDAKTLSRNAAWDAWQFVKAKHAQGLPEAEVHREADARERFYAAQDDLEDVLAGNDDGAQSTGLYAAERRLRLMLGLPSDDGRFIRPADSPPEVNVQLEWNQAAAEAVTRRYELRKQRWLIKQRELELIASRNFRLPDLDLVGTYRFRGFGNDLTSADRSRRFNSSLQDLTSLDHQEWQLGFEMSAPLGYRRGYAAIRHAELQLARERVVLHEQERVVLHELGEAVATLERAHSAVGYAHHRLNAAEQLVGASWIAFRAEKIPMDQLYSAQSRLADARTRYYRSRMEYAEANKNLQKTKGSLLEYDGVYLNEGPWPRGAAADAAQIQRRWRPALIDYRFSRPPPIAESEPSSATVHSAGGRESEVIPLPPPSDATLESAPGTAP